MMMDLHYENSGKERRECLSDRRKMAMRGVISNTCILSL